MKIQILNKIKKVSYLNKFRKFKDIKELYFKKNQFNSIYLKRVSGEIDGQVSIFDLNENININNASDTKSSFNKLSSYIPYIKSNTIKESFDVISLFSGMGGLDKAFKDQGYNIKFAIDKPYYPLSKKNIYDKDDCSELETGHIETYKYNIGNHIVAQDILTCPVDNIPKGDVYIAGIPCTELSMVSPKRGKFRLLPKFVDKFIEVIRNRKLR